MNQFTGYELLWLFLIYSFLGWVLETVIATVRQRKVVNRGLINGPFCIIYGIGAVLITIWLQELSGLWLFLFSAVYASVVEWIAGHLIQKIGIIQILSGIWMDISAFHFQSSGVH